MTMTIYTSNAIRGYVTIEQVVAHINNGGTCEGIEGIEFSPEQLAGQYAFDAISESDYTDFDEDALDAHLDFLVEAGAEFNRRDAINHGLILAAAVDQNFAQQIGIN
jgi:hypothetical protein